MEWRLIPGGSRSHSRPVGVAGKKCGFARLAGRFHHGLGRGGIGSAASKVSLRWPSGESSWMVSAKTAEAPSKAATRTAMGFLASWARDYWRDGNGDHGAGVADTNFGGGSIEPLDRLWARVQTRGDDTGERGEQQDEGLHYGARAVIRG